MEYLERLTADVHALSEQIRNFQQSQPEPDREEADVSTDVKPLDSAQHSQPNKKDESTTTSNARSSIMDFNPTEMKEDKEDYRDSMFLELVAQEREYIAFKERVPAVLTELLMQLNKLDFTRKEITTLQWDEIRGLTNLHTLILNGSPSVSDTNIVSLSNLDSLTALDIRSTAITNRSLATLSKLTSLTALDIRNTSVSDILPLTSLRDLRLLDCRGSPVLKDQTVVLSDFHKNLRKALTEKEGYLYKRGAINKNWKKRWVVLADSHVKYYKTPDNKSAPKGDVLLSEVQVGVVETKDKIDKQFCFKIETKSRTYYFQAEDRAEMIEWLRAIVEMYKYKDFLVQTDSK
eukprot:TRINITY_DN4236_c0_g1_i3.p1 TRINITY_DN4236_c0_g1~~TRINITY_DN4236_c0_g1_i3.p1  ORF type:complete len:392 (-),score=48.78 TRINITY_DN4236_c0_g1_i3:13-1056(-)